MKEFITVCPRNCYSTCSFKVFTIDNRIVRILPDESNMAVSEGPCLKGLSYIERAVSEKRLNKPLLRHTDGTFKSIEYNEALDIIAEKLGSIRADNKQKSVLYYTGSGMSGLTNEIGYNFFNSFGGATTCYGNFCWPAGLEANRLSFGEIKHNAPWLLEDARLIIIWGKNPAETNIQETVFIDRAAKKGAKVVVIDPRRTATADKADLLLRPVPGTDAVLALAIARYIIENNYIDSEFIADNVHGFKEYKDSLNISPDEAARISGVPAEVILSLSEMIGNIKPMTIIAGFGMQRYTNGGQTIRTLLSLCALTGNIGIRGAGFNYANLQGYVFDKIKEPQSYYPGINSNPLFRREISMARLGDDLWAVEDPEITFAWFERGNPVTQAPDTETVIKALSKIKFIVVVEQFMTDTARYADIILPAKNMFEQQDIISSYWSPYICYKPWIIEPVSTIKPESEIYYELAKKLKLSFSEEEIPEPGVDKLDSWLENRIRGFTEFSLKDFKEGKKIVHGTEEVAYQDLKFKTKTGKIELLSEDACKLWDCNVLPAYKEAFGDEPTIENAFIFLSPNTKNRIHSQFGNLEVIRQNDPEPFLQISSSDAKKAGIRQNDLLRVYNGRGEITVKADVTPRILSGCVAMPNGWWISEKGGGNFLSKGRETDMGHGTAFHDNLVRIEKLNYG
jgi:anaerobic selenocysteine-containing dehydrogenase